MTDMVRSIAALRGRIFEWHREGLKVALVPTMGALHEGHLQLVRQGFKHADRVVVSIFVNPTQFSAHEDLDKYPRTEEQDLALLKHENADLVFVPNASEMYRNGHATTVHVAGPALAGLEDKFRPHFFDGVATVVAKLFIQSQADFAMFGEKDYQQLMVVTQMAFDLDLPIQVVGVPTVREIDGMAQSSRNRYLSAEERQHASSIFRSLRHAAEEIRKGVDPQSAALKAEYALTTLGFKVDYVSARNATSLAIPQSTDEPLRLLAAAWLGKTRLIDNIAV
jgi:pantoate--beta-alanine ligase